MRLNKWFQRVRYIQNQPPSVFLKCVLLTLNRCIWGLRTHKNLLRPKLFPTSLAGETYSLQLYVDFVDGFEGRGREGIEEEEKERKKGKGGTCTQRNKREVGASAYKLMPGADHSFVIACCTVH